MFGITNFTQPIIDFSNFSFASLGSAAIFGGAVLLIGMVTIFAVLSVIWLCLTAFKFVFHDLPEKRAVLQVSTVAQPVVQETEASTDESEIIAVIAAAIAMAESENSDVKFKVVSFKRK